MLHGVRAAGNAALHEGTITADEEDIDTVLSMMRLVNRLVTEAIEDPQLPARLRGTPSESP